MPVRKAKSVTPKAAAVKPPSAAKAPQTVVTPAATPAPVAPPAAPAVASAPIDTKPKKSKLVRDSFTVPKDEYAAIDALKLRAAQQGHMVKKSELLRAGLKLLAGLDEQQLLAALQAVPSIKTGRPAKTDETPVSQDKPAARSSTKSKKTAKAS